MPKPPNSVFDSIPVEPIPTEDAAIRLGLSVAMGLVVALFYHWTLGRRKSESTAAMPLTLVLLSLLVCMVMVIVGSSVARAFTLGGTLAIIRYRTSVDDTRDTAFVIAAVVSGMGIGTDMAHVVYIGLPLFALVLILSFAIGFGRNSVGPAHKITVRVAPDRDLDQFTATAFTACPVKPLLLGIETAKQGAAIDVFYSVKMLDTAGILKLVNSLRQMDGVQGVEVKPQ
ncbi:DUF4956 domain-containing protein [soil metagenome]